MWYNILVTLFCHSAKHFHIMSCQTEHQLLLYLRSRLQACPALRPHD